MAESAFVDVSKLLSGGMLSKLFGVAALIVFTRILTKDEMSVFPAYLMLAGLCDLLLTFGIFSQFLREVPSLLREDYARARSLIMTASMLLVVGTVVPAIAALVFNQTIAELVFRDAAKGWIVAIMVPGFIAYLLTRIGEYVMWARGQFGATSVVQVIDSISRPVLTVALYLTLGFKGVVIGIVAAQFVQVAVSWFYVKDIFLGPWPAIYPIRKMVMESAPYFIGNFLAYLRTDGDALLVTTLLGPAWLAEYYVAKTLYVNVSILLTAMDKVAVERLARSVRRENFGQMVHWLHVRISRTSVPLVMLVIAVTPLAMAVLAGQHYAGSTGPAIVLLIALLLQFVAIPLDRAVYLLIPGFVRIQYGLVESSAVVAFAFALVPYIGLVGVAAARAVALVATTAFGLYMLRRTPSLSFPFGASTASIAACLPGTVLALLLVPAPHDVLGAVLWSGVVVVGWGASYLAVGFLVDRAAIDELGALAVRQYRALFSA